jgi:uncharacterized membrane protein (DUF2068 family)
VTERAASIPGTTKPRRFVPKFHWELLVCGVGGHELVGTDAEELRPEDQAVARPGDGDTRWHRCLRCDSWLPLPPPEVPTRRYPPSRDEVELPPRGKALRDRIVLRLIAIDRAFHFLLLGIIAAAIFLFAANRVSLRDPVFKVLTDIQSGLGGPAHGSKHGVIHELRHLFSIQSGTLTKIGFVVSAYALIEGAEAVGLWFMKRWAEYLTLIATTALLPLEVYELSHKFSPLKVFTLILNVAIVVYLLFAKRLFGLRGGAAADEAERERDSGWPAIDRGTPAAAPASAVR